MNNSELQIRHDVSLLSEQDIYLFKEGSHYNLYDKLGAHPIEADGVKGYHFGVWAPNAERVSVIGEFNDWQPGKHELASRWDGSGIWEGFIEGLEKGAYYKYYIVSRHNEFKVSKGDPLAFYWEMPPGTASRTWDFDYQWNDEKWMAKRGDKNKASSPMSIYEIHLGSWMRGPKGKFLSYVEVANNLAQYVKDMGFTHVQFMPITEHPFYGSWGYQTVGYFAPTSRYGEPEDLMYLIDHLHANDIGVILDWVPSHFPSDEHGLVYFDGTHLYEHSDKRKGFHPDWKSYIFNYGRNEVREYLISSAMFWLDKYHIDGLRVDAVASMLYLDYSRKSGEWIPNEKGGRENLEAIDFLRKFNEAVYGKFGDVVTIAEESTAWPMVSKPTYTGGLGFGMKWNMGWMHDTLSYFTNNPIYRKYDHEKLTFSIWYSFSENFVLALSHDEVVHGKGSLLGKMPGDNWQKFANMRLLFGYMFTHPGKKHLFMGGEVGQLKEWDHDSSLELELLERPENKGLMKWVADLNGFYSSEPAMHELDFENEGFEWIDFHDMQNSVTSFLRKSKKKEDALVVVCNFTPVPRYNYLVGVPEGGFWREVLNSDAKDYGGSGQGNMGGVDSGPVPFFDRFDNSISVTLPPLAVVVFKHEREGK